MGLHHFLPNRGYRLEGEGMVAINGLLEVHSKSAVQEALDNYRRKQKMVGNRGGLGEELGHRALCHL